METLNTAGRKGEEPSISPFELLHAVNSKNKNSRDSFFNVFKIPLLLEGQNLIEKDFGSHFRTYNRATLRSKI